MKESLKFLRVIFTMCTILSTMVAGILVAMFINDVEYTAIATLITSANIGVSLAGRNIIGDILLKEAPDE